MKSHELPFEPVSFAFKVSVSVGTCIIDVRHTVFCALPYSLMNTRIYSSALLLTFKTLIHVYTYIHAYIQDICYTVKLKDGDELDLLKDVSGHFEPGSVTCLMGSSGAG